LALLRACRAMHDPDKEDSQAHDRSVPAARAGAADRGIRGAAGSAGSGASRLAVAHPAPGPDTTGAAGNGPQTLSSSSAWALKRARTRFPDLQAQAHAGYIRATTLMRRGTSNPFPAVEVPGIFSDKDWLTTVLLSFVVGWLGIDRFYLGYTRLGILKLIGIVAELVAWLRAPANTWNVTTDQGVNRSRVDEARVAQVCAMSPSNRAHTSPIQRHCADCATALGRERSREWVRKRRGGACSTTPWPAAVRGAPSWPAKDRCGDGRPSTRPLPGDRCS
jgi:hypothetical protein